MIHPYRSILTACLLLAGTVAPADAQIRGSELASVSQTLDGTTVRLTYSRPSARGRTLVGELVPWNVVWTPGANWATTLETDRNVRINDVEVDAGAYSVWMTPREGAWTLTLNEDTTLFHFQKPDTAEGRYNIAVHAEAAPHMEMLTWSFPTVRGDAATLAFQWGETRVAMDVMVQPTRPVALHAEERARYLGQYSLDVVPIPGWPEEGELRVTESGDGTLRGWMSFPIHPDDELTFDLVPAGPERFSPGLYQDGRLFNVEPGVAFEFTMSEDDRAAAVVLRAVEGTPLAEGRRTASAEPRR